MCVWGGRDKNKKRHLKGFASGRGMLLVLQKSGGGTCPPPPPTRFAGPIFRCRISEIIMMMHVHNVAKFQEEPGSEMTDAKKDCVLSLCYTNIVVLFCKKIPNIGFYV